MPILISLNVVLYKDFGNMHVLVIKCKIKHSTETFGQIKLFASYSNLF